MTRPGHTLGHIVFHDKAGKHLFTADALFSLGVGRMFEGTPGPMWEGVKSLRALPDDTLVYCGHEYTASNARFALSIDPDNAALQKRAAEVTALRAAGKADHSLPARRGQGGQPVPARRRSGPGRRIMGSKAPIRPRSSPPSARARTTSRAVPHFNHSPHLGSEFVNKSLASGTRIAPYRA